MVIYRVLIAAAAVVALAGCEEPLVVSPSYEPPPEPRLTPVAPLPVVSFATLSHYTTAGLTRSTIAVPTPPVFAEMSGMYFCVPTGQTRPILHCASELQAYDPETYEMVHAIYRGSADLR